MALDVTNASLDRRILIEIQLDSGDWRITDRALGGVAMDNGNYYDPVVVSVGRLRQTVGRLLDPKIISPAMQISVSNTDDAARNKIEADEFANRTVLVKVGQGNTYSDYETKFSGTVRFPGGITWDQELMKISLDHRVPADERVLPPDKITTAVYANSESKALNKPIPLIYGDWRSTAGGGETVPAYCVDTTAGTGGKFKVAAHAVKDIEKGSVSAISK